MKIVVTESILIMSALVKHIGLKRKNLTRIDIAVNKNDCKEEKCC